MIEFGLHSLGLSTTLGQAHLMAETEGVTFERFAYNIVHNKRWKAVQVQLKKTREWFKLFTMQTGAMHRDEFFWLLHRDDHVDSVELDEILQAFSIPSGP